MAGAVAIFVCYFSVLAVHRNTSPDTVRFSRPHLPTFNTLHVVLCFAAPRSHSRVRWSLALVLARATRRQSECAPWRCFMVLRHVLVVSSLRVVPVSSRSVHTAARPTRLSSRRSLVCSSSLPPFRCRPPASHFCVPLRDSLLSDRVVMTDHPHSSSWPALESVSRQSHLLVCRSYPPQLRACFPSQCQSRPAQSSELSCCACITTSACMRRCFCFVRISCVGLRLFERHACITY